MEGRSADLAWAEFYNNLSKTNNFYPENFVTRVFLSRSPVAFLPQEYQGKSILDIGCGHGRNIPFLKNNGFNVTGLEVSDEQVGKLHNSLPGANYIKGTAKQLPCSDNEFDYALACNSIYYLTTEQHNIKSHFDEVRRVVKSKGYFVFSMLGEQHSIFNDSKPNDIGVYTINSDFLRFRQGIKIQGYRDEVLKEYLQGYELLHHGEVLETVSGTCRHIHYFVAQIS